MKLKITQEENKVDEKVKERKPRQGRPPKRPAPETPLNEPVKEKPLDELRKMFDSEVKKLWEAFRSITKQINQPPNLTMKKIFKTYQMYPLATDLSNYQKAKKLN